MPSRSGKFRVAHHEWHSPEYVREWIAKDARREADRRALLRRMLALAPFAADAGLEVLDVGGGYGLVTDEVLSAFPRARVTLQDYSERMIERARRHLAGRGGHVRYILADLRRPSWSGRVGGPFDLVVSAIAIHNLADARAFAACYRAVHAVLKPGGCFLDCDHFDRVGGIDAHLRALRRVGFEAVECAWQVPRTAIVKAVRPQAGGTRAGVASDRRAAD